MSAYHNFYSYMEAAAKWETLSSELSDNRGLSKASTHFAETLVDACLSRTREIAAHEPIFRARIMPLDHAFDPEPLPLDEMSAPPVNTSGRLSSEDASVFYGALETHTAVAEVRPWPTARITVAEFRTVVPTSCIDLVQDEDSSEAQATLRNWARFIFSRPMYPTDSNAYRGTQCISKLMREAGVAGVVYESRLRMNGTNIALFRNDGVLAKSAILYEVAAVEYSTLALAPEDGRPTGSLSAIGRIVRGHKA